jgi:DNA-binding CsgD family transcriptional regulator
MPRSALIALACLVIAAMALALTLADAALEPQKSLLPDVILDFGERLILIGSPVIATLMILRVSRLSARTEDLALRIERAANEGRAWRAQSRRFVDGLSRAIEIQFETWGLTAAEADVAGMLLKGASLREIAVLRRTSEATIRQQAQAVYRKSGLASRSELAAFFLEDLFTISEAALAAEPPGEPRYLA